MNHNSPIRNDKLLREAYEAGRASVLNEDTGQGTGTPVTPPPGAVGYVIRQAPNGEGWIIVWYSSMNPDIVLTTSHHDEYPTVAKPDGMVQKVAASRSNPTNMIPPQAKISSPRMNEQYPWGSGDQPGMPGWERNRWTGGYDKHGNWIWYIDGMPQGGQGRSQPNPGTQFQGQGGVPGGAPRP